MKIHEVAIKLGLTKKSIRYYEEEGLLNPNRESANKYRTYSKEDVDTLRLIKFLRELNIPINDIKKLFANELTLTDCMQDQIKKLENIENNTLKIKNMCQEIIKNKESITNLDIAKYSEIVGKLKKNGFTLQKEIHSDFKEILSVVLTSIICIIFFGFFIVLFTMLYIYEDDMPILIYLFLVIMFALPILGVIYNLIARIKEIRGGEEYEARKY